MRSLLCICGAGGADADEDLLRGWDVCMVRGLREAAQALRARHYLVGLVLGLPEETEQGAVDRFLREHWNVQWVGVFERRALDLPGWRELVVDHLCDFHTRPIDPSRLLHTLGHAHGWALLREAPAARATIHPAGALIGHSAAMVRLRAQIARVAPADAPVLIWGESGSGKELAAQAIHAQSARAARPFVPINCGAVPASLIQSELFGHVRGAFTGADRDKAGLIESANGGTVFLDEIGDLPRELQSNLLRFLQEKTIHRLGSTRSSAVDARVIAASHVRLEQAVADGVFREDLYYRLNVLPIEVPPLRQRKDDLVLLAEHFFHAYEADKPARLKGFSGAAVRAIGAHDWPGNVRELINRVRRALVLSEGRLIGPHDLGLAAPPVSADGAALGEWRIRAERAAISASLDRTGRNITHAARELGVSRMTLYRLLAKHGLDS